jgi:hypothetical protein
LALPEVSAVAVPAPSIIGQWPAGAGSATAAACVTVTPTNAPPPRALSASASAAALAARLRVILARDMRYRMPTNRHRARPRWS